MKNLILSAAVMLAICTVSFSCTCLPTKIPAEELEQSAAVFSGKVIEVRRHRLEKDLFAKVEAVVEVDRVWKGIEKRADKSVEKRVVTVFTSPDSAACGFAFAEGRSYFVYAMSDEKGRLSTTICSRTRPMKDAGEDLNALGPGKKVE